LLILCLLVHESTGLPAQVKAARQSCDPALCTACCSQLTNIAGWAHIQSLCCSKPIPTLCGTAAGLAVVQIGLLDKNDS
jgi:hypothetical protein